jgi:hypothetical protein
VLIAPLKRVLTITIVACRYLCFIKVLHHLVIFNW